MPFDGIDYHEADLVYPAAHHPLAPCTGPALGSVLRLGYAHARCHGRRVLEQSFATDLRDTSGLTTRYGFAASTWVKVASAYRRLHREATHLVAEAHFAVPANGDTCRAFLRASAYDGTHTDTGAATETTVETRQIAGWIAGFSPFDPLDVFLARAELEISTVTLGVASEVTVEAYALNGSLATTYVPKHVTVWMEVRG